MTASFYREINSQKCISENKFYKYILMSNISNVFSLTLRGVHYRMKLVARRTINLRKKNFSKAIQEMLQLSMFVTFVTAAKYH